MEPELMELSENKLTIAAKNSNNTDNSEGKARFRRIKLKNAVEITITLVFLAISLGGTATYNLIMYRTCLHTLNYNSTECESFLGAGAITHTEQLEKEVQERSTIMTTIKSVVEGLGPAVLSIFVGGWSDKHGRKPLLAWPLLGMTLSALLTVAYSMLEFLGPWWIIVTILPFTLTGGYNVLMIGVMCYITDITTQETKAFSFVIMQTLVVVSGALAGLASSYILKAVGMVYLLAVQSGLYVLAYLFTKILIEESMKNRIKGSILTIFELSHVKAMLRTCFLKKPNYGRAVLLLVIAASTLSVFIMYGGSPLMYLYTRAKIQWSMKDYTIYSSISSLISFVGSCFAIGIIQRILPISDLNFVGISIFSSIIENIAKALTTTTWHMYLSAVLALFGSLSVPLVRTFVSKTVAPDDVAKVFGLMGCVDAIIPILAHVVYNTLYAATIYTFPAAILVLNCGFFSICLVFIVIAQYLRSKATSVKKFEE